MRSSSTQEEALRFYYFGFHSALVRYRLLVLVGWIVVIIGCAGFLASCHMTSRGDVLPVAVPLCAIVAGLALVHQSIAALDLYVSVPFPPPDPEVCPPTVLNALNECARLMEDVNAGGWQEAFTALRELRSMGHRFGLPPVSLSLQDGKRIIPG